MSKKIIALCIVAVLLIALIAVAVNWNQILLTGMMAQFHTTIAAEEAIEILDTASVYGKLNGNGNSIDYYGAALVKADSEETLKELVAQLEAEFSVVGFEPQESAAIESKYLEHENLAFDEAAFDAPCYQIYFYCNHPWSNMLDPKGH